MAIELVVIGASLGGLEALQSLIAQLDVADPLAPSIVIAQHRRAENSSRLIDLLQGVTSLRVQEAVDHQPLLRGELYLAPPDYHLLVEPGVLHLSTEAPVNYARPSIDVLFETAAEAYGQRTLGVLLTGASEDGAAGAAKIVAMGGRLIVQDPASAVSPVAPNAALRRVQAHHVVPLADIGRLIVHLGRQERPA